MATDIKGSNDPSLPSGVYTKDRGAQGQNGPQPSSIGGAKSVDWRGGARQLSAGLNIDPPKGDAALAALKAGKGPDAAGSWQNRNLADGKVPDGYAMHPNTGSPSGKVQAGLADSAGTPDRKPGQVP